MQLNLSIIFATNRYHGRISEDESEFPPSPSRLFQALIAGSHCGAYNLVHTDKRDRALRWLESLSPPEIEIPTVIDAGIGITNYIPNNDDKYPLTHVAGSGHVRTAKSFLAKAFPETKPILIYRWHFESSAEAHENAAVLCQMAKLITHLGQHQDTVYASGEVTETSEPLDQTKLKRPIESADGNWSSPTTGSLQAYQERYQAWLNGESKDNITVPARAVDYQSPGTIRFDAPMALYELWENEEDRLRFDARDLREPAGMVRRAMINWLKARPAFAHYKDLASQLISGHESATHNDAQFNGAHFACVPIPSLHGSGVAHGRILRVLVVGYGCESEVARELFDSVTGGINGAELFDKKKGKVVGFLKKAPLNDSVLSLYTGKAYRVWRTVTPLILTGMMRRGRGAEVLILRALKQAGVDENSIASVAAFTGPIVPKTFRPLEYLIDKNSYLSQTGRFHAEVIFTHPAKGLLVVGRGRHCGFGLMMPCAEKAPEFLE